MTMQNPQVRRATIEDLPKLAALWQAEELPVHDLEKRFKEFQVIEGERGTILGAAGLELVGHEARLHSEAFAQPEQSDALRALFWERFQVLGQNHGLVRVWTQFDSPFWTHSGFQAASAETLAKLPAAFNGGPHPWRVLSLRPEPAGGVSIDKEFALFKEIERERTEKILRHAKVLKLIAGIVVVVVFVLVAIWIVAWYRTQGHGVR